MKTEEWKCGYVRDQEVVVFNTPTYSFPIFGGHFIVGVKVIIGDEGTLRITGTEICYDFYLDKTGETKWNNEPEESEVKVEVVGIFKKRTEKYLQGWVKTKKRVPFDLEFGSGWMLERR